MLEIFKLEVISEAELVQLKNASQHQNKNNNAAIAVCENSNEIAIFSMLSDNDQRAIEINRLLNDSGCIATGPISPSEKEKADRSEIRFFHLGDREDALAISDYISGKTGEVLFLSYVKELGHKAPKKYLEVWIK